MSRRAAKVTARGQFRLAATACFFDVYSSQQLPVNPACNSLPLQLPTQVTRVVSPTRMRASPPNLAVERYETARDERLGIVHTRNPADIIVSMAEEPVTVVRPISPRLVAALEAVPRAVSPGRYIAPLTTSVDSGALNISAVSPVAMMEAAAAAARARAQALAELQAAIPTNISPVSPYKL